MTVIYCQSHNTDDNDVTHQNYTIQYNQNEMMNLFQSYSSLMKSSGAGDKVFALLDREPPPPATGNASVQSHSLPVPATSEAISIELQDLSFAYPSRPTDVVLMSFNLKVSAGQTVALVGPSGCGKSTIAGLLQRFYDPSQGGVFFDGIDLRTLDIKGHRYVPCIHGN